MAAYNKKRWNAERDGRLTEAVVRLRHGAPNRARVSRYIYEPADEVEGTSKRATGYVLGGRFVLSGAEGCVEPEDGGEPMEFDVFEFPGGDYTLRTSASTGAEVVWAWTLPPGLG